MWVFFFFLEKENVGFCVGFNFINFYNKILVGVEVRVFKKRKETIGCCLGFKFRIFYN